MDEPAREIERIIREIADTRRVEPTMRLFHDLSLAGDDAWDVLEAVAQAFGTSFEGFSFEDYFPEDVEACFAWHLRWLVGRLWKPLTVRHLADVAERGRWFEPASAAR